MNKRILSYITAIGLLAMVFATGGAWAGMKSYTGSIQGANCVVHNSTCPVDGNDAHTALENDFVLLQGGGKYFFLPNIERSLKTKYIGKNIRVTGDLKGDRLLVSKIAVKDGGSFKTVWDWKEISKNVDEGGFR